MCKKVLFLYRVVVRGATKEIESFKFTGYGSHSDNYPHCYVTFAAAVGMQKSECDLLVNKVERCLVDWIKTFK